MLPQLSCLSVRSWPGRCLRRWCSSGSLCISPLHPEFHVPLRASSDPVFTALSQVSQELSPQTEAAACAPFTPSNSGQRSPPTYYRGCWHVVSRGFFLGYRPASRPPEKRFTTRRPSSRTRRRSVRVAPIAEDSSLLPPVGVWAVLNPSVAARPLRPATDRRLGALLPHQLANRPQAPLSAPSVARWLSLVPPPIRAVCGISPHFCRLSPTVEPGCSRVPHPSATQPEVAPCCVRLACVTHAASVGPEPGSNSPSNM